MFKENLWLQNIMYMRIKLAKISFINSHEIEIFFIKCFYSYFWTIGGASVAKKLFWYLLRVKLYTDTIYENSFEYILGRNIFVLQLFIRFLIKDYIQMVITLDFSKVVNFSLFIIIYQNTFISTWDFLPGIIFLLFLNGTNIVPINYKKIY